MHPVAISSRMSRVVLKLGGGLITDKSRYRHVRTDRIDAVSSVVRELRDSGQSVVLVHGAGSFGHLEARKWGLADGIDDESHESQIRAISRVRADMDDLNRAVIESLSRAGVDCETLPPRDWAIGVGTEFEGDLGGFVRDPDEPIPVTFGDVVDTSDGSKFGILSGDHIMVRLGCEMPDVTACAFLLGDVDGLMDKPPGELDSTLLRTWSSKQGFSGSHDLDHDVTGGILLKAGCASEIARCVEQVWLLNGAVPRRVLGVVSHSDVVGTRILH
ncbi:MAG: isopentenyl phosphate kinase [Candidatus Thalassarchaeaceae archaeon]|nr:isopentenyl phosphate kinase [Candidatus Thalassarchaeaceae archaeon]